VLDELRALGLEDSTAVVLHGDHGWQLGEHNSWHKFTNFELGTRVPLIVRAPWKPASIGARVHLLTELIDLYPTLSELVGAPTPRDQLDGVSVAPLFDQPSRTSLPTPATRNKTVAYSQYPHRTDHNCMWYRDGKCFNSSSAISDTQGGFTMMGFRVRDLSYSFCVWLPWDSINSTAAWPTALDPRSLVELYDHRGSNGSDFDAMDVVNIAYDQAVWGVTESMYSIGKAFFDTPNPGPTPPGPGGHKLCHSAGGILAKDRVACCPKECGKCGGKGCAELPGGKQNCCQAQVEANGRECGTSSAPCSA